MRKLESMALAALEVPAKELNYFEVKDPFNPHTLAGYICRRSDHRYGALYITRVDGKPMPQLVLATPKFPYPFTKCPRCGILNLRDVSKRRSSQRGDESQNEPESPGPWNTPATGLVDATQETENHGGTGRHQPGYESRNARSGSAQASKPRGEAARAPTMQASEQVIDANDPALSTRIPDCATGNPVREIPGGRLPASSLSSGIRGGRRVLASEQATRQKQGSLSPLLLPSAGDPTYRSRDQRGQTDCPQCGGSGLVYGFPKDVRRVEAYEKLDGTNIYGYKYRSWGGKISVTFKTRLLPVLQESRFGPFLTYWREMLCLYPTLVDDILQYPGYGLSFELYGARNKHLLIYDVPIDTRLLFGVRLDGQLEPPSAVENQPCRAPDCQVARTTKGLENIYKAMQAELEAGLTTDDVLGGYRGAEGRVWYVLGPDGWRAFKCKPETIEAIHWAAGGLGMSIIKATAYNVLENHPRCTPELIKELLLEEFNETEIDIAWHIVMRVSARINEEVEVREKVFDLYAQTGLDFASDPPAVMRALSPHLPKNMMQYAYALLVGLKS